MCNSRVINILLAVLVLSISCTKDSPDPNPENDYEPLRILVSKTDASGPWVNDGSAEATAEGGAPPYLYLWTTGDTASVLQNLAPGVYSVTVTDASDSTASASVEIFELTDSSLVSDIDGNIYSTVDLGNQVWLGQNLRVESAPDGTPIESYCYNDDTSYAQTYGRLYTWYAAMNGSAEEVNQGICPDGWRIPSDQDWIELELYLGMLPEEAELVNVWRGAGIGSSLIEGGESGYNAPLGGRRSNTGNYVLLDQFEYTWTSTELNEDYAWRRCLRIDDDRIGRWNTFSKSYAFSVRCIKE